MFDDKDFSRSKLYFRLQQLCRIFTSCIEETLRELQFHDDAFMGWFEEYIGSLPTSEVDAKFQDHLSKKWKTVIEKQVSHLETILERVKRKGEEVESLRDGVRFHDAQEIKSKLKTSTAVQRNIGERGCH
jgi:hypothetical protein